MNKCILLVGPDLKPFQSLPNEVVGSRNEWDFAFASRGGEAFDQLAARSYDAAVVDLALSDFHGVRVLEEIKKHHPRTLRFAYAPVSPDPASMMYWGAEHHLLIKPCTERTLHEVLRRTFSFAHWLPDNALHGLVSNLQIIPSPPPLYTELLLELQSPQSSLDSVGQLISRDPAMTAKMLQLANSAALGLQQQVTDASTAVMYLGGETVKALVLLTYTFSYFDSYKPPESCLRALWTHLLVSAQCARLIGQVEGLQGEAAAKVFTAGVLHDLGKLVLAVNLPGPFAEAMEAARQYRRPLWKVERDLLGASHAEIGAALLGIWRVPDEIVEAVAWHHEPSRSSESSFRALTVVHAANVFAHERRPDDSGFAVPEVDENYLAELGLAHRVPLWRAACQSV